MTQSRNTSHGRGADMTRSRNTDHSRGADMTQSRTLTTAAVPT